MCCMADEINKKADKNVRVRMQILTFAVNILAHKINLALKPCTHGNDLHIYICFAITWLFKISRICQKLKFNFIKMIDMSSNS